MVAMRKKHRILIIDDSVETVDGLESFFCNKYEVLKAYDGLDGLKQFEQGVDLVITDLMMPDISGFAIVSILKTKSPQLPVIAMTGWGEYSANLAREEKADLVLTKPFELDDLDRHVSLLLTNK